MFTINISISRFLIGLLIFMFDYDSITRLNTHAYDFKISRSIKIKRFPLWLTNKLDNQKIKYKLTINNKQVIN